MSGRHHRKLWVVCAALLIEAAPGLAADDETPDDDVSWRFEAEFTAATDDYSSGLTTTDHKPAASVSGTLSFDDVFGAFELSSDGDRPDAVAGLSAGYTPSLGDYAFEFKVSRDFNLSGNGDGEFDFDASVAYSATEALELRSGITLGVPDGDASYVDLTAGATYSFENGVAISADALFEPENSAGGNSYVEVSTGVSIPFDERFSASANIAYDQFLTDRTLADYAYWDAGISYQLNDMASFDLRYYANSLSAADCSDHADFDCAATVMGSLTLSTSWPAEGN